MPRTAGIPARSFAATFVDSLANRLAAKDHPVRVSSLSDAEGTPDGDAQASMIATAIEVLVSQGKAKVYTHEGVRFVHAAG